MLSKYETIIALPLVYNITKFLYYYHYVRLDINQSQLNGQ